MLSLTEPRQELAEMGPLAVGSLCLPTMEVSISEKDRVRVCICLTWRVTHVNSYWGWGQKGKEVSPWSPLMKVQASYLHVLISPPESPSFGGTFG